MTSAMSMVRICRTPRLRPRGGPARSVLRTFSRAVDAGSNDGNNGGMSIYDSLSSRRRPLPPNNTQSSNAASSPLSSASPRGTAWYVCGPTVYDSAHLGHGRTYVLLDILRRVAMKWHTSNSDGGKPRPLYVMNITDVDDKIINRSMELQRNNRAGEEGEEEADPIKLARNFEREFWEDMEALNVLRPDVICRVSEHVESTIVPYIQQIVDGGMAYVIPEGRHADGTVDDAEGSVYFDVRAFEALTGGRTKYGKLAPDAASTDFYTREPNGNNSEDAGVNNNDGEDDGGKLTGRKRDPRDFCLWKYRPRSFDDTKNSPTAPGIEPISVSYASPWGYGRPGWHVECSAMIQRLSEDFASTHEFGMHAGGVDLKFPHHANEIAQAEAYLASSCVDSSREEVKEWIPHWVHTGHLYVKGRKMSKSLKNFVTVREMLGVAQNDDSTSALDRSSAWVSPADDFRLWCLGLSGAYRGPATYSQDRMDEARAIREGWIRFLMEGQECLERWKSIGNDDNGEVGPTSSTRLWGDEELQLFHDVTQCNMDCRKALADDLDGASFVKELNRIAEVGLAYVERAKADRSSESATSRPDEPLRFALDAFRGQLELVGFSVRTVNAGLSAQEASTQQTASTTTNAAFIGEAVAFRTAVRSASLGAIRKKTNGLDAMKEILGLCDEMRDVDFPKLGVEILDGKVVQESDGSDANRGWRYCSPRGSERKS